jgi:ferric enterobactin receptor
MIKLSILKTLLLLFIINVFCITSISAQNTIFTGSVSGILQDSQTKQPIEYGTVAVLHANDSSLAGGSVSDENGNFRVEFIEVFIHRLSNI